ncbi:MAG: hypothetical protein JSW20_11185 [Nitrospiraceae bacterium]|nr:MAG: hypothetical protein JSW20_11185 [Nitrospiraceae bacterium]
MKQLKGLTLISFMLLIFNCKTAPSPQYQGNSLPAYLIVTGNNSSGINNEHGDIVGGQNTYIDMNEETFMNKLNSDLDNLALIEGIWSNVRNTYQVGIHKTDEKDKYIAFILNSKEPSMKKGEIIAAFYKTRSEYIYFTEYSFEDKTKIVTKTYIDEHGMLQIILDKWGKENVAFLRNSPMKKRTEEDIASDVKQSLTEEDETGIEKYYIQVSASKNHNDAQNMLEKIKPYYPDAYIVEQNDFSKIRIPGILTRKQGVVMSKDIERKFNVKPILVLKKQ